MNDGRKLRYDPGAASSDPNLPGFLSGPEGAPAYHGFTVVPESMTDGWAYGAITEYDCDEPQTEGDGFVIAPDGSRAGIAWATDTPEFYEILPPDDLRWGVYGVRFARPVACVEDLVRNFREVLPKLKDAHARLHDRGLSRSNHRTALGRRPSARHSTGAGGRWKAQRRFWVATLAVALAVAGASHCAEPPGRAFDPVLWSDPARVEEGVRLGMADRLLADGSLIGLTRSEVVAMLGEPPPTAYFADWDVVYRLGDERGYFSIDSEWLIIRLGPDGRVAKAQIVTD